MSRARCLLPLVVLCSIGFLFAVGTPDVASAAESADASSSTSDHGGHETGPPMTPKTDLVIWSLITFGVFLFTLKKLAWKPMIEGLDKRESHLRGEIAEAEAARAKSEKLLAEHEAKLAATQDEVKEILAEARRDAESTKQDIVETAQREAEATKNRAIGEIERATEQAIKEIFDSMSAQVAGATEHVLGRALDESDRDRLIDDALAQMAQKN